MLANSTARSIPISGLLSEDLRTWANLVTLIRGGHDPAAHHRLGVGDGAGPGWAARRQSLTIHVPVRAAAG
jgi:hypothetical protein